MRLYYGGTVVYQQQSDDGVIEVVDLGDTRSLHFGTYPRQSSMSLLVPHRLELDYTKAMMACLLLNPVPERVLVIGLGGGSLVKFLLYHFPHCQIDVVEYRQDVIEVAQRFFSVPVHEPRLNIVHGDGYLYVQQHYFQDKPAYDMVLVDAYDHVGMAASVGVQAFFDACAGILSEDGVLSINLWGSNKPLFHQTMMRIKQSFANQTLILPVKNKGNVIAFAAIKPVRLSDLKQRKQQAHQQDRVLGIHLPQYLQELVRHNSSLITHLLG